LISRYFPTFVEVALGGAIVEAQFPSDILIFTTFAFVSISDRYGVEEAIEGSAVTLLAG